ncbi:exosome complex component RRP40-like isoform X2 [Vespa mandarinia]|uniref:exosome complex component RRP40-like isoform X2 n=1 Tax=Vespa mandarinia TaxID=7446 RepID=UPI001609A3E7|nr:exosome complex component RRP40-like isoform X2 [Vespa mandarinia]
MEVNVDDVVMPGDIVKDIFKNDIKETVVLGPGLRREADTVFICKAGILKKRPPAVYYVNNYQKRYVPTRGENVIGIVIQKVGDIFKVDIGAKESAALSYLAFEGATKKNRPDIQVGDIVFAKLLVAIKDMEPELVCVDSQGKQKKLGVLSSDAYEVAIGMNGKVWIKTKSVHITIAIANAILAAEYTSPEKMQDLCNSIEKTLLMLT